MRKMHCHSEKKEVISNGNAFSHRHWGYKKANISGGVSAKRIAIEETNKLTFLVAMRLGETPVHIPNTMVKT